VKKLFFLLLLILIIFPIYSEQVFFVDTSRGQQRVFIPDGMSEVDAFLEMCELYLEERFAHEETIIALKELNKDSENYTSQVESYKKEVKEVTNKYDDLVKAYENQNKFFSPVFLVGVSSNILTSEKMIQSSFGLSIKQSFIILLNLNYPFSIGFSIGGIF
jgi:hypothetical protein